MEWFECTTTLTGDERACREYEPAPSDSPSVPVRIAVVLRRQSRDMMVTLRSRSVIEELLPKPSLWQILPQTVGAEFEAIRTQREEFCKPMPDMAVEEAGIVFLHQAARARSLPKFDDEEKGRRLFLLFIGLGETFQRIELREELTTAAVKRKVLFARMFAMLSMGSCFIVISTCLTIRS